ETVKLVDSHGCRDGCRNGERVAEIPGCGRGDSGETSGSDEDTIIVSHEPSDEKSIMFEIEWPGDSLYRLLIHGSHGGSVAIIAGGVVPEGKTCGMNQSSEVLPGRHEWRITWRESKEGCFTSVERVAAKRTRRRAPQTARESPRGTTGGTSPRE